MSRENYKSIIDAFLEIPILTENHKLSKSFEDSSDEELSEYITVIVIPHTIAFFSQMMYSKKNYIDVVQNIINELKNSKEHFAYYQKIITQLP